MMIASIQKSLNFEGCANPIWKDSKGIGKIATAGFVLGVLFGLHLAVVLCWVVYPVPLWLARWSWYMVSLAAFHFSEFFTTALYKAETATYDSFVINHSVEYTVAALASWGEFWVELLLFPGLKRSWLTLLLGLVLVSAGQACRVLAMHTAKSNFSHIIMEKRETNHQLVTWGIYSYLRHPSYFGWFWWVVGTQVLLWNPLCLVGYAYVSWKFFDQRIRYEEGTLLRFYPEQYPAYRNRTHIGIPFINTDDNKSG